MVTFVQMAQAVNNLAPFTHWIHESTLAKRLGATQSELEGFVKCVREGGSGTIQFQNRSYGFSHG